MLHFDPLPEPRDPLPQITYRATLRRGGELSEILSTLDHPDYASAIVTLQQLLPDGTARTFEQLDLTEIFGAVHRHELYEDAGRIVPLYFYQ